MRPREIFTIELSKDRSSAVTQCCFNPDKGHTCQLTYSEKLQKLMRKCVEGTNSDDHHKIPDFTQELERWLNEQNDFTFEDDAAIKRQLIYKYLVLRQIDLKTHYSRLVLPTASSFNVPIQPGLFKGTYSSHGLELITLVYEEDQNKVTAVKVTVRSFFLLKNIIINEIMLNN